MVPDEAAGTDRRTQREDRPTHDEALRLGDDDAGLRQVDELAEEIRGSERTLASGRIRPGRRRSGRRADRCP